MSEWINVAPVDELTSGKSRLVESGNTQIAVFNLDGEYFAIEDICTHDGSPMLGCGLPPEDVIDGEQLVCPRHGARFCIRTGTALTPPAYEAVARFQVREESGMVQVMNEPTE